MCMSLPIKAILFLFASALTACAYPVVVLDGDTIKIGDTTYRIHGIDAPELKQKCGDAPCGEDALAAMVSLIGDSDVRCDTISIGTYGRSIAKCYAGDVDLGAALVKSGMAWAYVKYSSEYVAEEAIAKASGLGIWKTPTQPAWEYRAEKRVGISDKAPEGCVIKGNISENGKIYHPPWSPWYSRTSINLASGERWFCSEEDAKDAGWRSFR